MFLVLLTLHWQIKAVAAFADLELEIPAYEHYVDNKKPAFLSKFPHGQIPAFEGANGLRVFEGIPIARYGQSSFSAFNIPELNAIAALGHGPR